MSEENRAAAVVESPEGLRMPAVPLTVEGASVLHQMMRFRWAAWRALSEPVRREVAEEAVRELAELEGPGPPQSALFSLLGHKGDLMFIHFRPGFEELGAVELHIAQTRLSDFLEPATSYLSMIELGLYQSTPGVYAGLLKRGLEPGSEEWTAEIERVLAKQRQQLAERLWPPIPDKRYVCFYPMDRKRGEKDNWYAAPLEDRKRLMAEHGETGRRYAGQVRQIISASIGFDDWEWGVDLFADDPLVFKKLVYEMRFDEVSALYALFGSFYVGVRVPPAGLGDWLAGRLPART
jgi:hydrogen peroxide-dependent heme synthase